MVSRVEPGGKGPNPISGGRSSQKTVKSASKKRSEKISDYWGEGITPVKPIKNKAASKAKNKRQAGYDKEFPSGPNQARKQQDKLFDVGMRYTDRIKPKPKGQPQKGQDWPKNLAHDGTTTPPKVSTAKGTKPKPKKK